MIMYFNREARQLIYLYIYFCVNAKSFLLMGHTEAGHHLQRFLCHVCDRLDPKGRAQQNWTLLYIFFCEPGVCYFL
jgi:hypothetical protein